jgi:hypothetical protein
LADKAVQDFQARMQRLEEEFRSRPLLEKSQILATADELRRRLPDEFFAATDTLSQSVGKSLRETASHDISPIIGNLRKSVVFQNPQLQFPDIGDDSIVTILEDIDASGLLDLLAGFALALPYGKLIALGLKALPKIGTCLFKLFGVGDPSEKVRAAIAEATDATSAQFRTTVSDFTKASMDEFRATIQAQIAAAVQPVLTDDTSSALSSLAEFESLDSRLRVMLEQIKAGKEQMESSFAAK